MVLCKVESISIDLKSMQTAFINISEALKQQNHVEIVVDSVFGKKTDFAPFASFAGIPHIVAKFDSKMREFQINSSAIVSLNSIESLESFNSRTSLHVTLSMSQQLIIHCQDATFEKIAMIKAKIPIIHFEYFMIEEGKSIRLLTFVFHLPKTCFMPLLVEVNRFDKTFQRW